LFADGFREVAMKNLGSFSISLTESRNFARASGDFNPLHIDPVAARRTRFGQTLIHGVCGTIKALDLFLQQKKGQNAALLGIKVKYSKPVTQDQEVTVLADSLAGICRLELFAEGIRCQIIDLELIGTADAIHLQENALAARMDSASTCVELAIGECSGLSGAVELLWDKDIMHALFPNAARCLPEQQLATLVASTQIVGMRCPGLHSVFAQLDMHFSTVTDGTDSGNTSQLEYSILSLDERIDRVELGVSNAYATGTVEAFFRPPPAQQAGFGQIAKMVSSREFCEQNALVIGASRGLGEVITKVLAAGGANIMMTYATGRDDAARISEEIGRERATPEVCFYNVLEGTLCDEMAQFCASVTHIYYLASPTIEKGDSNRWNRQLFTRFCDFYIDGLATLLQQVKQCGSDNRKRQLFIPSSVFLEQRVKGFNEYIAAKAAAEAFVQCFEKAQRNWKVVAPRLPRLHTDQTSSIKDTDEQHTLNVVIDQLRLSFSDAGTPID
jgi:NAD(P)-dependent dehydrogenase (short-subunit alcohol dehydrogenase family)